MNPYRKIQMSAAAVIANGALALGLSSSSPALATTCNPHAYCVLQGMCQVEAMAICTSEAPPGCTYSSSLCSYPSHSGCSNNLYLLYCQYK